MAREKLYATWAHVIFVEAMLLFLIAFIGIDFLLSNSIEVLKALVVISSVGFFTSLFLLLSAMGKIPLMIVER